MRVLVFLKKITKDRHRAIAQRLVDIYRMARIGSYNFTMFKGYCCGVNFKGFSPDAFIILYRH